MQLGVNAPDQGILVGDQLAESNYWCSRGMKGHGKEDVVTLHAPEACYRVADGEGAGVACMQVSIEVRIRYG